MGSCVEVHTFSTLNCFKMKALTLLFMLLLAVSACAQTAVSGIANMGSGEYESIEVYLHKLDPDYPNGIRLSDSITGTVLGSNGFFSFDQKYVSTKNTVYRLSLKRVRNGIMDTLAFSPPFILSKKDRIRFNKGSFFFGDYETTNPAGRELQRLQAFEAELLRSQLLPEENNVGLKDYTRDSLRILMVKLIGIRQLHDKQLLDTDLDKNPEYYLALLQELQESDIPAGQYRFLERKLAFIELREVERKYAVSRTIIGVLTCMLLALGTFLLMPGRRPDKEPLPRLSRQEERIRDLIVKGRSNKEIANELFISLSTVKSHITNIYGKLKVSNRHEMVRKLQDRYGY